MKNLNQTVTVKPKQMELSVMSGGLAAKQERLAKRKNLGLNAHMRMLENMGRGNGDLPKNDQGMKPIYAIVSFVALISEETCEAGHQQVLHLYNMVEGALASMPVSTFMRWFPIEKVYDGKRWGAKDYYSTMKYLHSEGYLNDGAVIGNARKLLWAYQNPLIFDFVINAMVAISSSCKAHGEETPMEYFFKEQGVPTCTMRGLSNGKILLSADNGSQLVISKTKPQYLQGMKGGKML